MSTCAMASWRSIFGHDEPYDEQVDGIETAVETAREGGFTVIEGACGTGKTMLALTAGIELVRDPDSDFERVVVLTSVKQQLRQFEEDLRLINRNLPEDWRPVSALTLVGKADVCPYNRENAGGIDDGNVYDRCESLRERTRNLTADDSPPAATLAGRARSQQSTLQGRDTLETAGEMAPYGPDMPDHGGTEYCPFYAQYLADVPDDGDAAEAVPIDPTGAGLIDPEELVWLSVQHGTCPHTTMGLMLGEVEVVVGNYYHAFDPRTVSSFTGALLDSSTFVICDEAHMLEPRVRDLVSDSVADSTLRRAETELSQIIQPATTDRRGPHWSREDAATVSAELDDSEVSVEDLVRLREFLSDLREELDRRVVAHLEREHPGWRSSLPDLEDAEIPLRDPETPQPDGISEWAKDAGYGGGVWVTAPEVASLVSRLLDDVEGEDQDRAVTAVGRVLSAWYREDHERYFREIDLERTWDDTEPDGSWRRAYNASLSLQNCVPGDAIGDRLAEFGGGILMSATLEPLDVLEEVTGLKRIENREDRPVVERTYGLSFPEENRVSFAVDAPKFTYDNRGPPDSDSEVRRTYAEAIRTVARLPGNVLVGMPSYAEAEWAADALGDLDKPVLLDESSDDSATEDLKSDFFDGDGKVLVTSLRGTLTEGVDYRGDRLTAAVVCGVPIVNTASPRTRAIRTAYDREFGDGFEYALTIPAVRKARQAVGRVIRGPEEVGARVLVDARYARDSWDSVRKYFPDPYRPVSTDMLEFGLEGFRNDL